MKVQIKANAVAHLTDARYFSSMDVEWLGFNLDPMAENSVHPAFLKSIREWISGPVFVGEFNYTSSDEIIAIAQRADIDAIHLGPLFPYEELKHIPGHFTIFSEIMIEHQRPDTTITTFIQQHSSRVNYFILNFSNLSDPISDDWINALKSLCSTFPIFINRRGDALQICNHIRQFNPLGYCLTGASEEKTGVKSFEALDEIFDALADLALK
jgi:phosphoribosylanthranilate isomerase